MRAIRTGNRTPIIGPLAANEGVEGGKTELIDATSISMPVPAVRAVRPRGEVAEIPVFQKTICQARRSESPVSPSGSGTTVEPIRECRELPFLWILRVRANLSPPQTSGLDRTDIHLRCSLGNLGGQCKTGHAGSLRASPADREIALVSGAVPAVDPRDESVHRIPDRKGSRWGPSVPLGLAAGASPARGDAAETQLP
jgi:hypothetical protein